VEKDSEEESADDDGDRNKIVEDKDSFKLAEEKATKSSNPLKKIPKSKAIDSRDDLKSDKIKPEPSKQSKVSLLKVYFQKNVIFSEHHTLALFEPSFYLRYFYVI